MVSKPIITDVRVLRIERHVDQDSARVNQLTFLFGPPQEVERPTKLFIFRAIDGFGSHCRRYPGPSNNPYHPASREAGNFFERISGPLWIG